MPYALVAKTAKGSSNNNDVTTDPIDATGATFAIAIAINHASIAENIFSDSGSHTWTARTPRSNAGQSRCKIYDCASFAGGASHTFSLAAETNSYPTLIVYTFSGDAAAPFDAESGNNSSAATSIQPGSIAPAENDELFVTGIAWYGGIASPGIDSGFSTPDTILTTTNNIPGGGSYKIQTAAGAENPTWSWTTLDGAAVVMAAYKAASGGGEGGPLLMGQIVL